MSRYKNENFNFSGMSERITFQTLNPDGTYTDEITVWAHVLKEGFSRQVEDHWFKIMVREHRALNEMLQIGTRIIWRKTKRTLVVHTWQDPSYEDRGYIEIMCKQIASSDGDMYNPNDGEMMRDIVSIYRMSKNAITRFGLTSYEYTYDFDTPLYTGVRCDFSNDRNRYLEDKKRDIEHDSLQVKFNIDTPLQIEDYIISPIHGKFKVDMIVKNNDNMLVAHVKRSDVQ